MKEKLIMQNSSLFLNFNKKISFWIIQLIVWTIYLLYHITVNYPLLFAQEGFVWPFFFWLLLFNYFGIPLSLLLKYVYDKIGNKLNRINKLVLIAIIISFISANIWFLWMAVLDYFFKGKAFDYPHYVYPVETFIAFLILSVWSAFYILNNLWAELYWQKVRAAEAILRAENAQLKMLRYQLNPHFLFNSLSSLRALIREDKDRAIHMLTKISKFLKYSLIKRSELEVPLKDEIEIIRDYLEIEKVRFADTLMVDFEIDPNSNNIPVPTLILHPIIENAIKYGMPNNSTSLNIKLLTEYSNKILRISIENNGKWQESNYEPEGTSTGIQNIKERLQNHYPEKHNFTIDKTNDKVVVCIEILL